MIPEIIVQTSKHDFPWAREWKRLNPKASLVLLTDDPSEAFVETHYPDYLALYQDLALPVERADLFRYLAVHHFGGVYSDTDVRPLIPLTGWLQAFGWTDLTQGFSARKLLIAGVEFPRPSHGSPLQIVQWTFAATAPGHPLLLSVAEEVRNRVSRIPFDPDQREACVLLRTGPAAWTSAILSYIQTHCDEALRGQKDGYPRCLHPIAQIEKRGQYLPLTDDLGERWNLLLLPYRAFGYHPHHGKDVIKKPFSQHLVQHQFLGHWRQP